jgi:hypothetical protein
MTVFEIGKLYRWPEKDSCWTLYDNVGKWTKLTLGHQDVFLVLSFKKGDIVIDFFTVKVLISNGIIGYINIKNKSSVRKFVKLQ